jgi:glycosyltransferase involved in cell wall biosynthesis
MRIGIDVRFWNESGVGRYIRNLVWQLQHIDQKNHYVLFVNSQVYKQIQTEKNNWLKANSKWQIAITNIPWHSLEEQIKFPKILNQQNLDLMHFPYFSIPIFYNKPFIVTIHDLIIHHFPTGKATTKHPIIYHGKRLGYKYIMSQAAKKSKKILTVSNATKYEIMKQLKTPEEKIVVTYEGIDDILNPKNHPPSLYALNPKPYFLYVGNAYPHKNLDRLLVAFKQVITEYNDARLMLVGKKDFFYERLHKRIKELNMEKNIEIVHNVTDEKLLNLYKEAQAVVIPSLMEGFGLPAVEAMANSALVIASDIPALREICDDAAIYFNPTNSHDLAKNLLNVLKEPKSSKYLEKQKLAKERLKLFSLHTMAQKTLQVYENSYILSLKS